MYALYGVKDEDLGCVLKSVQHSLIKINYELGLNPELFFASGAKKGD
jgi:hypothetical protein